MLHVQEKNRPIRSTNVAKCQNHPIRFAFRRCKTKKKNREYTRSSSEVDAKVDEANRLSSSPRHSCSHLHPRFRLRPRRYYSRQTKYRGVTGHGGTLEVLNQENPSKCSSKQWRRGSIVLQVIESSLPSLRPSDARPTPSDFAFSAPLRFLSFSRFLSTLVTISLGPPSLLHSLFAPVSRHTDFCRKHRALRALVIPLLSPDNSAKSSFSISPENVRENTSGDLFIAHGRKIELALVNTLWYMQRLSNILNFFNKWEKCWKNTHV